MLLVNKYRAKSLYVSKVNNQVIELEQVKNYPKNTLVYFASQHEYLVYLALLKLSKSYSIEHQYNVSIIPPYRGMCFPNGKTWKVDFAVKKDNEITMLVEAKGKLSCDFPLILALLELNNLQLFSKLWLVFPVQIPKNSILKRLQKTSMKQKIITRKQLEAYLRTKNI